MDVLAINANSPCHLAAVGQPRAPGPIALATDAPAPAVGAAALRKVLDDRIVLRDLTFTLPRGRFVSLLGANGAGKSTLLRIISGLTAPTSGTLQLFGIAHGHNVRGAAALRLRIGLISHGPMLYRDLSPRENLIFFGRLYGVADPAGRADELLEQLGLADRARDPVKNFSRGMVQRAAIARSLLSDPDLLLADEPFSGLDAPSRRILEDILASLHKQGKTIILAHHDLAHTLSLVEHVLVLRRGSLVMDENAHGLSPAAILQEMTAT
jgi:heme exporter protein A